MNAMLWPSTVRPGTWPVKRRAADCRRRWRDFLEI